jgi:geranylgeranyl diphosphate synthase type II
LGKPRGSDERHGKRTYVSEFGIERSRDLAAQSHATALQALAEAAQLAPAAVAAGAGGSGGGHDEHATGQLEQITDFIYTRTS